MGKVFFTRKFKIVTVGGLISEPRDQDKHVGREQQMAG